MNVVALLNGLIDDPALRSVLQRAILLLARVLPLVVFSPMLGGQLLPARLRLSIAALLALLLALPGAAASPVPIDAPTWTLLASRELLVGFVLAFTVSVVFQAMAVLGETVDLVRGATMASVLDPSSGAQASPLGRFLLVAAIALFLGAGGHGVVLRALADGVSVIDPLDPRAAFALDAEGMLRLVGWTVALGVRLALPVLAIVAFLDVLLGLVNRVAPQVQAFFLGLTLKGSLGLGVLLVVVGLAADEWLRVAASTLTTALDPASGAGTVTGG